LGFFGLPRLVVGRGGGVGAGVGTPDSGVPDGGGGGGGSDTGAGYRAALRDQHSLLGASGAEVLAREGVPRGCPEHEGLPVDYPVVGVPEAVEDDDQLGIELVQLALPQGGTSRH